jgi:hypothetical protein
MEFRLVKKAVWFLWVYFYVGQNTQFLCGGVYKKLYTIQFQNDISNIDLDCYLIKK